MKQEYVPIETLIERFFDGTTTDEEERELYAFFRLAGDDLPEHLREYRDVFAWFDTGIAGEISDKAPLYPLPAVAMESKDEDRKPRKPRKRWMRWTAVAASVLVAAAFYSLYTMDRADAVLLEGYVIRDGVKITDMDVIGSELEATMQMALMQEAKAEQLFRQLYEPDDGFVTAQQQVQQQYCQIISQFADPMVRAEVEDMLDVKCDEQ